MTGSTFEITRFLKAVAILSVLVSHYFGSFMSESFTQGIKSIFFSANGYIAIFFFVSGYGIFFSLKKYEKLDRNNLYDFFKKRAIRIYSLFWIMILLIIFIDWLVKPFPESPFSVVLLNGLVPFIGQLSALPFLHTVFNKWFVYFIIQCYLLAPLLYYLYNQSRKSLYLFLVFLVTFANILMFSLGYPPTRGLYAYRGVFLGHIAIFGAGFGAHNFINYLSADENRLKNRRRFISGLSLILFIAGVYYSNSPSMLFKGSQFLAGILMILSLPLLCSSIIAANFNNVITSFLEPVGKHSYSIYLFNGLYFNALETANIIQKGRLTSLFVVLLIYPVYFKLLFKFEDTFYAMLNRRWLKWQNIKTKLENSIRV